MENSHESQVVGGTVAVLRDRARKESEQSAHPLIGCPAVVALRHMLSSTPINGKAAKQMMASQGFSAKQIRVARENLGVEMTRSGFGVASVVRWSISLPALDPVIPTVVPQITQSCPPLLAGTTEVGHDWEHDVEDL